MKKPWRIVDGKPFVEFPSLLVHILFVASNRFIQSTRPGREVEWCKRLAREWKRLNAR